MLEIRANFYLAVERQATHSSVLREKPRIYKCISDTYVSEGSLLDDLHHPSNSIVVSLNTKFMIASFVAGIPW